jgi:CRISPR-associated exonuclease Cas4
MSRPVELATDPLSLRVCDLRQWTYCPRVVYWRELVPLATPETHKMKAGREEESRLAALEERRGLRRYGVGAGRRTFDVWLSSRALGLEGIVDMVIETPEGPIPVDYKMVQRFGEHQRLQLAAYAMLLEELAERPVPRGFLYAVDSEEVEVVDQTPERREKVLDAAAGIREMLRTERMPDPTPNQAKCEECEYLRFCNDVM